MLKTSTFGGCLKPTIIWGLRSGKTIISFIVYLAKSNPAISFHITLGLLSTISPMITSIHLLFLISRIIQLII